MIILHERRVLVRPTTAVRMSYLTGEQADCLLQGASTDWRGPASEDFDRYVAERSSVRLRWDVPSTIFWCVTGEHYMGTLVLRHGLTKALAEVGGHIGHHVVAPWRRQGHATRMLSLALVEVPRARARASAAHLRPQQRAVPARHRGQRGDRSWPDRRRRPRLDHPGSKHSLAKPGSTVGPWAWGGS